MEDVKTNARIEMENTIARITKCDEATSEAAAQQVFEILLGYSRWEENYQSTLWKIFTGH